MEEIERRIVKGGTYVRVAHESTSTNTKMTLSVFLPFGKEPHKVPVLYYLSGLTCTDQNFITKAGAFEAAGDAGIALVVPDTSPRGAGVQGEDDIYSLGTGAGFYVDATKDPWSTNYNMYSYITQELPEFVNTHFNLKSDAMGITGHSMGGHGALVLALRNDADYKSVSAFSPITNPTQTEWGKAAMNAYLSDGVEEGKKYDATVLVNLMNSSNNESKFDDILIDQGTADEFLLDGSLGNPQIFVDAATKKKQKVSLRLQDGYDHSYYFVASFIKDHIIFHANRLWKAKQISMKNNSSIKYEIISRPNIDIECKAMVAFAAKQPLELCDIIVEAPKKGEVRLKVIANALCHTDVYTLGGEDPEGLFPSILGHEAGCVVESVGEGVTSVQVGDHVIPAYTPQCCRPTCIFCQSPKTNLCPAIRSTQGQGVMPDGTSRFKFKKTGEIIYHFMGTSTMSEYTVVSEWSCAKIDKSADLKTVCMLGCGISTGLGAVWNNCKVEAGSSVAVFGLGAVGLSVVLAAKMAGASSIVCVDINNKKFDFARSIGGTHFVNPLDVTGADNGGGNVQSWLVKNSPTGFGYDYTFDCTGNVAVMRSAIECAHRGWGMSCIIGVAASGKEISTRPFQLVTGRRWIGTAFGGWKSRTDIPKLVNRVLDRTLNIDKFVTHTLFGIDQQNQAVDILHSGDCLRCVVMYCEECK
jgi:S-(hydroxymethyl)glutathione dehydrogenase / alcohol dehydrogenase